MAERIPKSDYDQLHHFISESPWDSSAVMDLVSEKVYDTLSTPNTSVSSEKPSIGLELDESGWEKAGDRRSAKRVLALLVNTLDKSVK
jgi:hypothetical protein